VARRRGDLAADEARADDRDAAGLSEGVADARGVGEVPQRVGA
jgi:hypothetical protein